MNSLRKGLIVGLLIYTTGLFAQEEPIGFYWADTVMVIGERNIRIPTISAIGTKMIVPLHSTPASIGVVTRPLFESQRAVTLRDALKNVSGVNVQNGFGTFDFFLIRGFESLTSGLVLTDGASEPEVSFYNLYNIDRVEVLKGPGAFLYGGNPLSGAVNLVRKQPVFRNFATVNGSYGEFQTYRGTFDVGVSHLNSRVAFRLNGLWQDSDSYRDDKQNNSYAINPAVTWKIDNRSTLTANLEYVRSKYEPDSGLPLIGDKNADIADVPRRQSYQSPLDDSDQDMYRLRLDYHRQFSNSLTIRNKTYFTQLDWQSMGTLIDKVQLDSTTGDLKVHRNFQTLDDNQKLFGNQLEALISFGTGNMRHNLVTGFEISRLQDDFDVRGAGPVESFGINLALIVDLEEPEKQLTSLSQVFIQKFAVGNARSLTIAPYFVDQISFSEQVQLFIGGRYDVVDYEDERTDLDIKTGDLLESNTPRTYNRFSPMAGVVVAPVSNLSLYANAGQSFAPPSTIAATRFNADGSTERPGPEESTQFEVGAKLKAFNGRLNSNIAVYHLQKDNISIPVSGEAIRQVGDQRSRGVEFELNARPTDNWYAFLTYAYTDAELTEFSEEVQVGLGVFEVADRTGQRPAFTPKHILNFWTSREFDNGIGIGGGLRFVSSQFIDEDNDKFKIDDYLTFDASIHYRYQSLRWSLNLRNVTDKEYETRGFGSASVTPANPRAIYGTFDFSL